MTRQLEEAQSLEHLVRVPRARGVRFLSQDCQGDGARYDFRCAHGHVSSRKGEQVPAIPETDPVKLVVSGNPVELAP